MIRMVSRLRARWENGPAMLRGGDAQPEVLPGEEGDAVVQLQGGFGEKVDGGGSETTKGFRGQGLGRVAEVGEHKDSAFTRVARALVGEHRAVVRAETDQRSPGKFRGSGADLDH